MRPTSVILTDFEYLAPATLRDALKERKKGVSHIIAGGTDLVPKMRAQVLKPSVLIDVSGLKQLDYVNVQGGSVRIGAATKISTIIDSKMKVEVLRAACEKLGNPLTRNRATIGGNLCNASPAADTATPLLVSGSNLVLTSLRGSRTVPIEEFFTGPGKSVLKGDEILTEVRVKAPEKGTVAKFVKVGLRKADAISVVNCAVALKIANNVVKGAKIALGSVAPTPVLVKEAPKLLIGKKLSEELIEDCAREAAREAKPISDVRGSARYRELLVEGCVKKALRAVMEES